MCEFIEQFLRLLFLPFLLVHWILSFSSFLVCRILSFSFLLVCRILSFSFLLVRRILSSSFLLVSRILSSSFLLVSRILCLVGNHVDIKIGVTLVTFLRIFISGYVQTSKSGLVSHMNMPPIITQNIDPAEHFIWQSRKLESKDFGSCPCSISGFTPALCKWEMTSNGLTVVSLTSGVQWILTEEQKVLMFGSGDSNPSKPLASSLQSQKTMAIPSEATSQDHVKGGPIERNIDSGNNSKEIDNLQALSKLNFLKNNFWSFLALLVLFLDRTIWQTPDIVIGFVVIMVLGLGIPGIVEPGLLATSNLGFEFPILMFLIAYFLVFVSLILNCTQRREWLNHFTAGAAYTSAIFGFLGNIVSSIPSEYARPCVLMIVVILVLSVIYIPDGADQMRGVGF